MRPFLARWMKPLEARPVLGRYDERRRLTVDGVGYPLRIRGR
jgi:hypothetical protein